MIDLGPSIYNEIINSKKKSSFLSLIYSDGNSIDDLFELYFQLNIKNNVNSKSELKDFEDFFIKKKYIFKNTKQYRFSYKGLMCLNILNSRRLSSFGNINFTHYFSSLDRKIMNYKWENINEKSIDNFVYGYYNSYKVIKTLQGTLFFEKCSLKEYCVFYKGFWYLIIDQHKINLRNKFNFIGSNIDGFRLVILKKVGYLKDSVLAIPCKFSIGMEFSEDLAVVRENGKYFHINKKGHEVYEKKFNSLTSFCQCKAYGEVVDYKNFEFIMGMKIYKIKNYLMEKHNKNEVIIQKI